MAGLVSEVRVKSVTVKGITLEVKQMTGWLKNWYNTKPNSAHMKLMVVDMQATVDASQGKMPGHSMMMGSPDKNFL